MRLKQEPGACPPEQSRENINGEIEGCVSVKDFSAMAKQDGFGAQMVESILEWGRHDFSLLWKL